jgi:hypothetical protein
MDRPEDGTASQMSPAASLSTSQDTVISKGPQFHCRVKKRQKFFSVKLIVHINLNQFLRIRANLMLFHKGYIYATYTLLLQSQVLCFFKYWTLQRNVHSVQLTKLRMLS